MNITGDRTRSGSQWSAQACANSTGSFKYTAGRLGYREGAIDASVYGSSSRIDAQAADIKHAGIAGSYNFGVVRLSASVTQARFLNAKQSHCVLGAVIPVGLGRIMVSYNKLDQRGSTAAGVSIDANDAQQFGLGYEYSLSKRTALYGNAARLTNKGAAKFAIPGGPAGIAGGASSTGYEVGMRHAF